VFGTEQGLRYRIPFGTVESVIDYLRDHATEDGDRVGMMGDDGEKFGAWPTTFEHCWGTGRWVERFFEALESNASWLSTITPSQWLDREAPIGRVYVPTSSYAEMGEWALPPDETVVFSRLLHDAVARDDPAARWLRGGFWRNFQVKYREINDLHKQMLRVSDLVDRMPEGPLRDAARDHLHRGQSNDCYWHGLFGGIYLAHMRAATLAHLIAAEDGAETGLGTLVGSGLADLDLDGRDELRLATAGQVVTIELDEGGGIGSWDVRAARHALAGVLRRRPEAYHEILRTHAAVDDAAEAGGGAAASIHEMVQVKEAGLADHLIYDDYERRSGLVRILPSGMSAEQWSAGGRGDLGDFVDGPFRVVHLAGDAAMLARDGVATIDGASVSVAVQTSITVGGGRRDPTLEYSVSVENRSDRTLEARIGVEWAFTLLGGGGNPQAWWALDGIRSAHDGVGDASGITELGQGNDWLGVQLTTTVDPAADAWHAPIETISNSEAGLERVYQGSALLLSWPVRLEPGNRFGATIRHGVRVAADKAALESAG
ncbi:MAG TPA: alpha-amylase/4-alpha-glucanotransferase domain-containing protein, partial [Candidatus Limnocylindrales bacterium]